MWEQHGSQMEAEQGQSDNNSAFSHDKAVDLSPEQVQLIMQHFDQVRSLLRCRMLLLPSGSLHIESHSRHASSASTYMILPLQVMSMSQTFPLHLCSS